MTKIKINKNKIIDDVQFLIITLRKKISFYDNLSTLVSPTSHHSKLIIYTKIITSLRLSSM